MSSSRMLKNIYNKTSNSSITLLLSLPKQHCFHKTTLQCRSVSSTTQLNGWMDKIKGAITGQKTTQNDSEFDTKPFTLIQFADQMKNAKKLGSYKQYMVGRSSEATFNDAFDKQEAIIRYLGGCDPMGENIQIIHKKEAAKQCNCTIADVENALSKFTWAKEAQKKLEKLKAEGKPMPKSLGEVQKLMGTTPLELARSNMAKSGQVSRNAPCPCGSKKLYKRCCGNK